MQLHKPAQRLIMGTDAGQMIAGILTLIFWVLGWFVMSVVPFLRKDFGERYMSWLNIVFGLTAIGFFTGIGNVLFSQGSNHVSWVIEVMYYGVIIMCVDHRVEIWRKNRRGELWHSYYAGTSLLRLPKVSVETTAKWIEPAVLFALAQVANAWHDRPLYLWLLIGAIAVFVHEQISFHMQRQQFLDMRDAMIASQNRSAAMSGQSAKQSHGFTIAASNLEILRRNPELKGEFGELPDDVKEILDEEAA